MGLHVRHMDWPGLGGRDGDDGEVIVDWWWIKGVIRLWARALDVRYLCYGGCFILLCCFRRSATLVGGRCLLPFSLLSASQR